jgi:3',5'-cyclic AMP phosphodiesterase CpdA
VPFSIQPGSAPFFAVPGNHDIPLANVVKRFVNPYGLYRATSRARPNLSLRHKAWRWRVCARRAGLASASTGPTARSAATSSWIWRRVCQILPRFVRIVVAHHPLMHPEEPMAKPMRRVKRADLALATFARLGVRLVLSGHFHMSYVRRHDRGAEIAAGAPVGANEAAAAPVLVAQASTTISTRRRGGHLNAYNLIDIRTARFPSACANGRARAGRRGPASPNRRRRHLPLRRQGSRPK